MRCQKVQVAATLVSTVSLLIAVVSNEMLRPLLLTGLPLAAALYQNGSVTAPCDSPLYCQGEILRAIQLAAPFDDSKTFVDLPTTRPLDEVIAAFNSLSRPLTNGTGLSEFLDTYFGQAGSELAAVSQDDLETDPTFLENVDSVDLQDFVRKVIEIWPDLTREYVGADNCDECVSSFIPLNRSFVVAGGRFREPYYWDSFWVIEGLLRTKGSFTKIALNIIENFVDLVDEFGFVPNGARRYYLNRSQPPLLTQMVRIYVEYTDDTSLLERVLPTLEKEYQFWSNNRTVDVEVDGQTFQLNHYAVSNNQPRPESYKEDYETATNESYYAESGIIYPATDLNDSARALLYSDLASGAESGFDYGARWIKNPSDGVEDKYFPLRTLNTREIIPVDLNSILYANEVAISLFHNMTGNDTASQAWAELAAERSEAMAAVLWDPEHWSFFDYNMTAGARNVYVLADEDAVESELDGAPQGYQVTFTPAQYYPFWTGAAPQWLKNNPYAIQRAYERVASQLERKAGAIPASNLITGQQWDEPNVWPPLMYILIAGLLNTPATFGETDPSYQYTQDLALNLSQRYVDSTFCTWRSTGGSTTNFPKLDGAPEDAVGIMFEKYADSEINAVGGGGEYEVVEGFGWSNGVLIWAADVFGGQLQTPDCGDITAADTTDGGEMRRKRKRSAVKISKRDARWIKRF